MPPKKARKATRGRGEAPMAEDGQQYARVLAMLGNGRVRVKFFDSTECQCRIRGNMRRREWVHVGDTVLVSLREDLAGEKADIVFKYQPAEVQRLRRYGEPVNISGAGADDDDAMTEDLVTFEGDDDDYGGGGDTLPRIFQGGGGRPELPPLGADDEYDGDGSDGGDIDWERI